MKKIKITFVALFALAGLNSCIGDHGIGNGKDTAENTYKVPKDVTNPDTVNVITHTGDSASSDYSSSGGAGLVKRDTTIKR